MELRFDFILRFDLVHHIEKDSLSHRTYLRLCRVVPKRDEAPFHPIKRILGLYIIIWTRSRPQSGIRGRQLEEHVLIDASLVGLVYSRVSNLILR